MRCLYQKRAESPPYCLVPQVFLIISDTIFFEKTKVLILKVVGTMMLFLVIYIAKQVLKIRRPYGNPPIFSSGKK